MRVCACVRACLRDERFKILSGEKREVFMPTC